MRLVNADELQMKIDEYAEHIRQLKKGKIPKAELAVLLDCKGCVDNAPTVDAVPVRHGKWIDDDYYSEHKRERVYRCSECGWHMLAYRDELFNYCPNCGARMDEE